MKVDNIEKRVDNRYTFVTNKISPNVPNNQELEPRI